MLAKKPNNEKKKRVRASYLVCLLFLAAGIYFAISFASVRKSINDINKEITEVSFAIEQKKKENDELRETINSENKDEYIESVARDKLGYVKSGEHVYYDISVND